MLLFPSWALATESVPEALPRAPEIQVSPAAWQARAKMGDWVRVRTRVPLGGERSVEVLQELRVQAVAAGAASRLVTVSITIESGGNREQTVQVFRVPILPPQASTLEPPKTGAERERESGKQVPITVGGKSLTCTVRESVEPDGQEKLKVKTWASPAVPCGGTVRIEQNGKAVFELLDFGSGKS